MSALGNLRMRLAEIDKLMEAHQMLVRFHKAQRRLKLAQGDITKTLDALKNLVGTPGRGRPPAIQVLNKAGIVLLSALLQSFVQELAEDHIRLHFSNVANDVNTMAEAVSMQGNPHENNINKTFSTIGIPKIVNRLHWHGFDNAAVKTRLRQLNELRNNVAHGGTNQVTRKTLSKMKAFVLLFSGRLDNEVAKTAQQHTKP